MPLPQPPPYEPPPLPEYLLIGEAAAMLRTPVGSLHRWRVDGTGPPAIRVGRKLLYPRAELMAWLDAQVSA